MTSRRRWRVRLTAAGEADVRDIVLWTANRFGAAQARAYADTLSRAIRALAEGPAVPGAGRRDDIGEGIMALHVARGGRKGRHVVLYRVGAPAKPVIDVLRVLHDAMDLSRHVGETKGTRIMHRATTIAAALILTAVFACAQAEEPPAPEPEAPAAAAAGTIDRLDARLDELLAADAAVEQVADGFQFIEGPVWVGGADDGHLLFSDIPADTVYRWSEADGTSVFLNPVFLPELETNGQGGSNGLTLDLEGRLVLCEHGNRRLARIEEDGSRVTIADRYEDSRLNSPNDVVFHSSGSAFFTDPPYGLASPEAAELDWNGVYRLDPDGTVHLLADGQTRPNGIGLSPDEATLYVANSDGEARQWVAYPVNDDLGVGEGTVLLDLTDSEDAGVPDGFAVDAAGNIWSSGPGGIVVISPEGDHLGTVRPAEQPANAAFGNDGRTLYITARTGLYRIDTLVEGLMP